MSIDEGVIETLLQCSTPLENSADLDRVLSRTTDARVVLIGEATHGTQEFYRWRAQLTRRLLEEQGFSAVAAEADWPDAYRINRFVRAQGTDPDATAALGEFARFPSWMWRNTQVADFVHWLRHFNDQRPSHQQVGFYGLDLYSLHSSVESVLGYLDKVDVEAAARARERYACFEGLTERPEHYGRATGLGLARDCEEAVVAQLVELQKARSKVLCDVGLTAEDEHFFAEQNARVVRDAERYYRAMFAGRIDSWNLRDTHMADTLDALIQHLQTRKDAAARVVVWAHNSHVGDASATEMGHLGRLNLGQLARLRHTDSAVLVGFSTYSGTVTAASEWGGAPERKKMRPALARSYEEVFHRVGQRDAARQEFLLDARDVTRVEPELEWRLQRAIGVVYRPETERYSHYFEANLARQFDFLLHLDETHALEALDAPGQHRVDPP